MGKWKSVGLDKEARELLDKVREAMEDQVENPLWLTDLQVVKASLWRTLCDLNAVCEDCQAAGPGDDFTTVGSDEESH